MQGACYPYQFATDIQFKMLRKVFYVFRMIKKSGQDAVSSILFQVWQHR